MDQHIQFYNPINDVELGVIEEMVASLWRLRRTWAIETQMHADAIDAQPPGDEIRRLAAAFTELAATPWGHSLVERPEQPALVLPHRAWVAVEWTLSESEGAFLEPGNYQIEAVLAVSNSPGWNGEAVSAPAIIRITESAEASEAQQASEALLRAVLSMRKSATSEAVVLMDELLLKQPKSVRALQLRAELAEKAGDIHLALMFANRALDAAQLTYSDPGKGLLSLILLRDRLYGRLLDPLAPTASVLP